MNDDQILEKGGTEEDIDKYAELNGATTEKEESWEYNWKDTELDHIWHWGIKRMKADEIDEYQLLTLIEINMAKAILAEKSHQQEELLKKIEAMKTVEVEEEHLNHSNKEIKKLAKRLDDAKRGYNKAIEEVLQVIK